MNPDPNNETLTCVQCHTELAKYLHQDGKTYLVMGNSVVQDIWGWCLQCNTLWIFHSSDKLLEQIIERKKNRSNKKSLNTNLDRTVI
jgi:hypothetical protein